MLLLGWDVNMLVMLMTCSQKLNYKLHLHWSTDEECYFRAECCSQTTTIYTYLRDNTTNTNYVDENATVFNVMSMKYVFLSIKDTKIDSYRTPKTLWRGGIQVKKWSDFSGESCLKEWNCLFSESTLSSVMLTDCAGSPAHWAPDQWGASLTSCA